MSDSSDTDKFLEKIFSDHGETIAIEHQEFIEELEELYLSNTIEIDEVKVLLQDRKDSNDAYLETITKEYLDSKFAQRLQFLTDILQKQLNAIDAGEDPFTTPMP